MFKYLFWIVFFIDNVVSYTWSNPVLLHHLFFFSKSLMKTIQIQNNQFIHGVMFKGVKSLLKLKKKKSLQPLICSPSSTVFKSKQFRIQVSQIDSTWRVFSCLYICDYMYVWEPRPHFLFKYYTHTPTLPPTNFHVTSELENWLHTHCMK